MKLFWWFTEQVKDGRKARWKDVQHSGRTKHTLGKHLQVPVYSYVWYSDAESGRDRLVFYLILIPHHILLVKKMLLKVVSLYTTAGIFLYVQKVNFTFRLNQYAERHVWRVQDRFRHYIPQQTCLSCYGHISMWLATSNTRFGGHVIASQQVESSCGVCISQLLMRITTVIISVHHNQFKHLVHPHELSHDLHLV